MTRLYVRFILSFKKEWSMSAYAIDLRCNLHGQVLVGRYLFASGKTQVERCRQTKSMIFRTSLIQFNNNGGYEPDDSSPFLIYVN